MSNAPRVTVPVRPSAAVAAVEAPAPESAKALVPAGPRPIDLNETSLATLRKSVGCATLTDVEFAMFIEDCRRRRLDPFCRQMYAIKRNTKHGPRVTHQTGIDGFRVIAERSGKYAGQLGPFWCGPDGIWKDVWLTREPPVAARVGILRRDFAEPIWGFARFEAYAQVVDGELAGLWWKMGENQLGKCAEAQAHRKAFPEDLGGLYIPEEMDQAGAELVGEIVPAADVVHRDVRPENVSQAAPPPATTAPLLSAEQEVKNTFWGEFAKVTSKRELDGLCWEIRRAVGSKPSPEFRASYEEMKAQALAGFGGKDGPGPAKSEGGAS